MASNAEDPSTRNAKRNAVAQATIRLWESGKQQSILQYCADGADNRDARCQEMPGRGARSLELPKQC